MTAAIEQIRNSRHLISLTLLLGLTVAMFADVLFTSTPIVLGNANTDLLHQFIHWRRFGFMELRHGNLALWNPHLFSGAPFFGGFQSALLYPPNALFLVLPLAPAINWSIALHVFLAGAFVYSWAAYRGLHPLACVLAAVMFMFGGTHFLHIYAGHLPNLCAMVWAPLLFLAIDGVFKKQSLEWSLLGMLAVAMQVLAGHPQYVFYTAVGAGVYSLLCLGKAEKRGRIMLGLTAICFGGVALSAVQLLTGLQESREILRSVGVSYDFAAMFSFAPENLLTLLAPDFFGDDKGHPYWGRCYLWEMSLFAGVTGFILAVYGALAGERRVRRFSVTMLGVLLLLALGAHTPLFRVLYYGVPGFDQFRGSSKFIFLATLFLSLLAGFGLDRLMKGAEVPRWLVWGPVIAASLVTAAAVWLRQWASTPASNGWWAGVLRTVYETGESYLPENMYGDASFVLQAGQRASHSLLVCAGTLTFFVAFLLLAVRRRKFTGAILLLAVVELFVFAHKSLDTFNLSLAEIPGLKAFLTEQPGDYRIANTISPNCAMSIGAYDIWGYDPNLLVRYAQFMAFTQGLKPEEATQYLSLAHWDRLYAMLRCRFALQYGGDKVRLIPLEFGPLARLQLIRHYRVIKKRDDIFAAMATASFDPRNEVILENEPNPQPASSGGGDEVRLMDCSTDSLTIEAKLVSPAILLITDNYSKGWCARALGKSAQARYVILPANYCLRAIPLAAGQHYIHVEYAPTGFIIGKWVSLISAAAYAVLVVWVGRNRHRTALGQGSDPTGDSSISDGSG